MLTHIHIWNFAIVEKLDIELKNGLTVLTGETGAGKSILLDALNLALGDRADTSVIRHGAEKAEISVTFQTDAQSEAEAWLKANELESENECIIRRVISNSGPSKAFINGKPAPIQSLRELGEMLVDLHGQHEHQSLLRREAQRDLLDAYAQTTTLVANVNQAYTKWKQCQQELEQLSQAKNDREDRLELLRYQVEELESVNLEENELTELENEHKRLANASKIIESGERLLNRLSGDESSVVGQQLQQSCAEINQLTESDPTLQGIAEFLENAAIQVSEATGELRQYLDSLELDPQRLEWVEQRLGNIQDLSRKHGVKPNSLFTVLPTLIEELKQLESAEVRADQVVQDVEKALIVYTKSAARLSKQRKIAATKLANTVTQSMQTLGMDGGSFSINLETLDSQTPQPQGLERVEFLVSANPGQPLKPLSKVASGGELSRISLAIQVITAENSRIPTLIFDEVDVGIGGKIAEIVGHLLRTLTEHRQVICVTHLPQVAALGHQHLQVSKTSDTDTTISQINHLKEEERIDELARMLGGIEITEQTLSHAREMIKRAQSH
jgi:DNA repair protein RecN (Recombination protein N)